MRSFRRHSAPFLAAVLSCALAGVVVPPRPAVADGGSTLTLLTAVPRQNGLVEFRVEGVPAPAGPLDNPFDPAQYDVPVAYTGPDGRVLRTTAFWHEGCLPCQGGDQSPGATEGWRARLLPEEPGEWTAVAAGGEPLAFEVAESGLAGVVRRSGDRLVEPDGTPFVALGENVCWSNANSLADYTAWYDRLAEVGANWNRLWQSSWAFGLEWSDTPLGDYRNRLWRAAFLDDVLALGAERGIRSQIVMQNHGAYASLDTWTEWPQNPFNAANGGPLTNPQQVWTNPTVKDLFKRRFRYVVSRYWAHPGMLAWELWNEADLVDGNWLGDPAAVAWHREMSDYVRSLDPLGRPITTSYTTFRFFVDSGEVFRLPNIDIVELHFYAQAGALGDFPFWFSMLVPGWRARTGRPVIVAEAGLDSRGIAETIALDPTGRALTDMAWGALFSGAGGSAMTWWWDGYVHPRDLYHRFAAPFTFARANPDVVGGSGGLLLASATEAPVMAHRVARGASGAVFLRNTRDSWRGPDPTAVARARMLLPTASRLALQWWAPAPRRPTRAPALSQTPFWGFVIVRPPAFTGSTALTYRPA